MGRPSGFNGLCHRLDGQTERSLVAARARIRIGDVLAARALVTAFQPIYSLETRTVIGAEALTRIVSSPVRPPETWFAEAASIGRGLDL
ncbi:MAG: EAL domain-containing protein, partial [Arthrobacter sp.]